MQQCVQENQTAKEDPEAMQRMLRSVEATVTAQAAQIARDEVAGAVAACWRRARPRPLPRCGVACA